jgi:NhaP-type Na+/H+ and K+/H+ antiporter
MGSPTEFRRVMRLVFAGALHAVIHEVIPMAEAQRAHELRGAAEAMETIAHGDRKSSKVVGRRVRDIHLPPGTPIGAIVRGNDVLIAKGDLVVESDDHVILFLINKKYVPQVERLFQVGITFF